MHVNAHWLLAALIIPATFAGSARAAQELSALAQIYSSDSFPTGNDPNDVSQTLTTGLGPATASILNRTNDGGAFTGTATATASFGTLGVYSDATGVSAAHTFNYANAGAGFTDSVTINPIDPIQNGTASTVTYTIHVHGTSNMSGDGVVQPSAFVSQGTSGQISIGFSGSSTDYDFVSDPIAFTFGVPFDLSMGISVESSILGTNGGRGTGTGTATGDYSHTLSIAGLTVAGGSATAAGSSGTQYAVTLEPASLASLALAVTALCFRRKRS